MTASLLAILVFLPFAGGLVCWGAGRKNGALRDYLADGITIAEFLIMVYLFIRFGLAANAWQKDFLNLHIAQICGFGLNFRLDGFRLIYGGIAALMWMMTTVLSREYFAHHHNRSRFYLFLLMTLGATMGVFLSADLFTTFIFFEIMSFTSYVWVAQEENPESLKAAATYLAVAVIGGLVMLMGIFILYQQLGTVAIDEILKCAAVCPDKDALYAAGCCMLVGFGAKAGAFPLHIWLPKAHPVAPAPASALLSGILTKTGIFGILLLTGNLFLYDEKWGELILFLGVLTMFGGALLALFSVDLKRTLACSSMSQIGFIMVGMGMQALLGEENALAVHGTMLHMVNHSMIKLVLFMAAGVIFMNTHALNLNEIRGFGRKKPLLKAIFLVGALAIGGIPMFGGYISKTLIHESIVEFGGGWLMRVVEYVFLFSGGLTVAYMTKLFIAIFMEKNENSEKQRRYDKQTRYMNRESGAALTISAVLLALWGFFPHGIMDRAAQLGQRLVHLEETGGQVAYFSMKNLSGALISIGIGAAVYLLVVRRLLMKKTERGMCYVNCWPQWLDLEELVYRSMLLNLLPMLGAVFARVFDSFPDMIVVTLRKTVYRDSPIPHELLEGNSVTLLAGNICNFIRKVKNRITRRESPESVDYVHRLAVAYDKYRANRTIIGRSMSFALFLFCIGFCMTLIYMLLWQ